jgi:hypothetical protein
MILENKILSSDRNRATVSVVLRYRLRFLPSVCYIRSQQCIFQLYVNFICTWT